MTARVVTHVRGVRTALPSGGADGSERLQGERIMNQIIYIVGAIVIVIAVLSFVGLA